MPDKSKSRNTAVKRLSPHKINEEVRRRIAAFATEAKRCNIAPCIVERGSNLVASEFEDVAQKDIPAYHYHGKKLYGGASVCPGGCMNDKGELLESLDSEEVEDI